MKEEKIYLYTFVDNDMIDSMYHLLTKRDCRNLIESIERFYYEFAYYDENILTFLTKEQAYNYGKEYVENGVEKTYAFFMILLQI